MNDIKEIKPAELKEKYPFIYDLFFVQPWGEEPVIEKVEQPLSAWEAMRIKLKGVKDGRE